MGAYLFICQHANLSFRSKNFPNFPSSNARYKTSPVPGNSINPVWSEDFFVFKKVVLPNLAHLRFCVYDENGKMLGHRVIPVRGLRPGYRHIHLRNEINQPMPLATLFVHLEVRDYVPDDFSGEDRR